MITVDPVLLAIVGGGLIGILGILWRKDTSQMETLIQSAQDAEHQLASVRKELSKRDEQLSATKQELLVAAEELRRKEANLISAKIRISELEDTEKKLRKSLLQYERFTEDSMTVFAHRLAEESLERHRERKCHEAMRHFIVTNVEGARSFIRKNEERIAATSTKDAMNSLKTEQSTLSEENLSGRILRKVLEQSIRILKTDVPQ